MYIYIYIYIHMYVYIYIYVDPVLPTLPNAPVFVEIALCQPRVN